METEQSQMHEVKTYRTSKPPDQYVISYNFEHANTNNITHNLLIGVGFQSSPKSLRKGINSNASQPNKQKLYSIISQPKTIFRNQAHSINKAYVGNILPKRYMPENSSKINKKQQLNSQQSSSLHQQQLQTDKQNVGAPLEQAKMENFGKKKINSQYQNSISSESFRTPYGSLLPEGNGKTRFVMQNKKHSKSNQKRNQRKIYHNKSMEKRQSENHSKKGFSNLNIRQNPQKQAYQNHNNNLKQLKRQSTNNNHTKSQNQLSKPKHHESLQLSRQINLHQRSNEMLHHSLIQQQSDEQLTTHRQKHDKKESQHLSQNNGGLPQRQKISICNIQNNDISQQQGSKKSINFQKSKKQIQDQQLQQLQDRVRKQNPHQIKKSHFKGSKYNEIQILPFQAGIQPLFANNKDSFSAQNIKTNPPYFKRPIDSKLARTSKVQSSYGNGQKRGNANNQTLTSNVSKPLSRNKNSFSTNPLSPNINNLTNHTNGQRQNIKGAETLKKQKSQNLSSIVSNNFIKRTSNQNNQLTAKNKIKAEKQQKLNSKDKMEDITENNQIKGFKVPQRNSSTIHPQKNKNQQNISSKDKNNQQNISKKEENAIKNQRNSQSNSKNNNITSKNTAKQSLGKQIISKQSTNNKKNDPKRQQKLPETSNIQRNSEMAASPTNKTDTKRNRNHSSADPQNQQSSLSKRQQSQSINKKGTDPKPTTPRNPNDKDYKFKRWKQSQLQQIQKEKRQSKIKNNARSSLIAKKPLQRKQSKLRSKQNKLIDLDAQQQDKFGLFSKKTVKKPKTTKKPTVKKQKQKNVSLTGPEDLENVQQQHNQQEKSDQSEQINDSQSESAQEEKKKLGLQDSFTENIQQKKIVQPTKGQEIVDQFNERISSIHSSKITEKQIEQIQEMNNLAVVNCGNQQNLQQLLLATEQINLNNYQPLTLDFNPQEGNQNLPNMKQTIKQRTHIENMNQGNQNEEKQNSTQSIKKIGEKKLEQENINTQNNQKQEGSKQIVENQKNIIVIGSQMSPQHIIKNQNQVIDKEQFTSPKQAPLAPQIIAQDKQHIQAENTAQNNIFTSANKDEDFFQFNIKQISKINETINQTFNLTKYQTIQKDIGLYSRAPIISFMYQNNQKTQMQINSFVSSTKRLELSREEITSIKSVDQFVDNAISLLLSIDPWIIQRIFEPYLNIDQEVGVWLYLDGNWKLSKVEYEGPTDSFRDILKRVLDNMLIISNLTRQMETILRIISGVRVVKIKSSKKRIFSELQYSLKKNHVLKALTAKDSKWGQKLFQVSGIETTKQGENVLKVKSNNSDYFWVKQEKFKEIFQHFLLICTRKSHFWTNKLIQKRENHKTVISIKSAEPSHGSITLFYPSQQKSSLFLYKEMQSRVLKFMGKIQQKANQNGNLYFEFKLHGSYYLFLETPTDCDLAIQSSCKLMIAPPQYVISQTLKNQKCEYVQIERKQGAKGGKQAEKLQWLKEKFINMVSNKRQ